MKEGRESYPMIVLASGSPRRSRMLEALGWQFVTEVPDIDEIILPGEKTEDAVVRLALEKALEVAKKRPKSLVIAADTVVRLEDEVLGKPADRSEAFDILTRLSGRTHEVFTGVAVVSEKRKASGYERTFVEFRQLSPDAIEAYLDCNDSYDKAGAYGIQEKGSLLVQSIRGCYFNVVGLPLFRLSCLLEELGLHLETQWRMGI